VPCHGQVPGRAWFGSSANDPSPLPKSLGERLKAKRRELGAAERLGWDPETVRDTNTTNGCRRMSGSGGFKLSWNRPQNSRDLAGRGVAVIGSRGAVRAAVRTPPSATTAHYQQLNYALSNRKLKEFRRSRVAQENLP
jgi:hypothetical protein